MKTLAGWKEKSGDFKNYVFPGEKIDVEIYDYFLGCVPTEATASYGFLMGEPFDFKGNNQRYLAFFISEKEYFYGGPWTKQDFLSMSDIRVYNHFHPSVFRINERGNAVFEFTYFLRDINRYYRCLSEKWLKYHTSQDADYFGVFVNWSENAILTFAEGDETIVCCPDQDRFLREYQIMEEFHRMG